MPVEMSFTSATSHLPCGYRFQQGQRRGRGDYDSDAAYAGIILHLLLLQYNRGLIERRAKPGQAGRVSDPGMARNFLAKIFETEGIDPKSDLGRFITALSEVFIKEYKLPAQDGEWLLEERMAVDRNWQPCSHRREAWKSPESCPQDGTIILGGFYDPETNKMYVEEVFWKDDAWVGSALGEKVEHEMLQWRPADILAGTGDLILIHRGGLTGTLMDAKFGNRHFAFDSAKDNKQLLTYCFLLFLRNPDLRTIEGSIFAVTLHGCTNPVHVFHRDAVIEQMQEFYGEKFEDVDTMESDWADQDWPEFGHNDCCTYCPLECPALERIKGETYA